MNNENREIIQIEFPDGHKKTTQLSRYLIEVAIDRYLTRKEEVHHIDGNTCNNYLSNLEIIDGTSHRQTHGTKYFDTIVLCIWCKKPFLLPAKRGKSRSSDAKRGKKGPFCSRRCSGLYGQYLQMSASGETLKVESPKVGETLSKGNPEPSLDTSSIFEGVETGREIPNAIKSYGKGTVQTTNRKGSESYSGKKIRCP